ncbi:g8160 [Coccomyxa viridis]|uniref:G8160 protein n=1 Tax=Coccomyxa viridis TaxID=1274662 RepID=A0ABP1G673_9CHLO
MGAVSMTSNVAFRATSQSVRVPGPRAFVSPMLPSTQQMRGMRALPGRSVVMSAQKDTDFDSILTSLADKFEKTEKKPAVIGWTAAAVGAFFLTEWLIHLPLLNVLLGFPLQLVGVLSLPWAYLKYVDEGDSIVDDLGSAAKKVTRKLPGLE